MDAGTATYRAKSCSLFTSNFSWSCMILRALFLPIRNLWFLVASACELLKRKRSTIGSKHWDPLTGSNFS